MSNKLKRKSVHSGLLKNDFGFTMISMLISLSLFAISAPFLSFTLKSSQFSSLYDDLSVDQFFIFIRNEMTVSSSVATKNNILNYQMYTSNNEWAKAELKLHNNKIVRVINGGYEVYLFDVKTINFINLEYAIEIQLETLDGDIYRRKIRFYE